MSLLEHENTPASYRDPIDLCQAGVPGLAQVAVGQGWRPLAGRRYTAHLAWIVQRRGRGEGERHDIAGRGRRLAYGTGKRENVPLFYRKSPGHGGG